MRHHLTARFNPCRRSHHSTRAWRATFLQNVATHLIRVLICDDQNVVREGLRSILSTVPGIQVVSLIAAPRSIRMMTRPIRRCRDVPLLSISFQSSGIKS
jgi:hypothetical protein